MKITKDIYQFERRLPIIALPEFFKSQNAVDFGYIVEDDFILPYYIKKKLFFKYLVFTVGIIGDCGSESDEEIFLNKVILFIKKNIKVDFISMNHVTALFNSYPKGSTYCKFGSYVLGLSDTEDSLFKKLHSKHRNVIKKAIKEGLVVSCSVNNKLKCISLIEDTLKRQKQAIPDFSGLSYLNGAVDYWIVCKEDELYGAAIVLWNTRNTAYYMFGGSSEYTQSGAMNFLQWEIIKKMKTMGVSKYDFVGARLNPESNSKYEGIQRFKARFGGELVEGILWEMALNKFKFLLYKSFIKVNSLLKCKVYRGNIIDQEINRGNV